MSTMNPTVNNYPSESIPDVTDEPPIFMIENVRSEVLTDFSTSSTSDLPDMYIPKSN